MSKVEGMLPPQGVDADEFDEIIHGWMHNMGQSGYITAAFEVAEEVVGRALNDEEATAMLNGMANGARFVLTELMKAREGAVTRHTDPMLDAQRIMQELVERIGKLH